MQIVLAKNICLIFTATTNTSDALNSISIGAGDTFSALSGVVPNITQSDGVISVCYGDYYSQTSVPSKIQLTFTMRVSTENYPDLNNFGLTVESTEKNNSIVDQVIIEYCLMLLVSI